jgi:hypothetical protein
MKLLGIISVAFDVMDQLLIMFLSISLILEKKWEYIELIRQLFIIFKKAYDSVTGKYCATFS